MTKSFQISHSVLIPDKPSGRYKPDHGFAVRRCASFLLLLFLSLSRQLYAQNGPVCDTYTNKNFNNDYVYGVAALTGPGSTTIFAATYGSGLYISTDGGNTFTAKPTAEINGQTADYLLGVYVANNKVYVATYNGLSISSDGGNTFVTKTTAHGLADDFVWSVYATGNNVYTANDTEGISVSTDGGNTFTAKKNGLAGKGVVGVVAVGNTIYAAASGGLGVSLDGGDNFTVKTTADGLGSNIVRKVFAVGNTIYVATTGGVSISTDGGSTFTNKTTANGLGNNYVNNIYALGNTVYASTNAGVSISTDGGNTFTNSTNGLGSNYVEEITVAGNTVYAATDNGLSFCNAGCQGITNRIYVKAGGTGNGSSWDKATGDLQAAIDNTCGATEIWVAQGTYKPTAYPTGCSNCNSNRDFAFTLKDGIKVYGGGAGAEVNLTDRNPASYTTILSGDIGTANNASDNCYHIVVSVNDGPETRLDGFIVQDGTSTDGAPAPTTIESIDVNKTKGAGLVFYNSSVNVSQCQIIRNLGFDGGVYTETSSCTFVNCRFADNPASDVVAVLYI